jgi:hypothetical protein
MKIVGRILAILIAAVVTLLTIQQIISRTYKNFGKKYITIVDGENSGIENNRDED